MTVRFELVKRLEAGERMTDLCREFGISRKTGYKIRDRFRAGGVVSLQDQSRRPHGVPHRTKEAVVARILDVREAHKTWGPKKIKAYLERHEPEIRWPAVSTVGAILKREGMIKERGSQRRPFQRVSAGDATSDAPNDLWCMDYKGDFVLGDKTRCYPLTVTDHFSRMILGCEACYSTKGVEARTAFESIFSRYGLPARLRSDNGSPFASRGLGSLTKLSAWLLSLGIDLERIEPGKPQQNGQHERMHLTLKKETTRPAAESMMGQQSLFDAFTDEFNEVRPHEAIGMRVPDDLYFKSPRPLPAVLEVPGYPMHDRVARVTKSGAFQLRRGRRVFLSQALVGHQIGLRELDGAPDVWLASFMNLDLAFIDPDGQVLPL